MGNGLDVDDGSRQNLQEENSRQEKPQQLDLSEDLLAQGRLTSLLVAKSEEEPKEQEPQEEGKKAKYQFYESGPHEGKVSSIEHSNGIKISNIEYSQRTGAISEITISTTDPETGEAQSKTYRRRSQSSWWVQETGERSWNTFSGQIALNSNNELAIRSLRTDEGKEGFWTLYRNNGKIQIVKNNADGSTETLLADGTREIDYKNGSKEIKRPDGSRELTNKDGSREETSPEGVTKAFDAQGRLHRYLADSVQREFHYNEESGLVRVVDKLRAGEKEWQLPGGASSVAVQENGDVSYDTTNDRKVVLRTNGTQEERDRTERLHKVAYPDLSERAVVYQGQDAAAITIDAEIDGKRLQRTWTREKDEAGEFTDYYRLEGHEGRYQFDENLRISSISYPSGYQVRIIGYQEGTNRIAKLSIQAADSDAPQVWTRKGDEEKWLLSDEKGENRATWNGTFEIRPGGEFAFRAAGSGKYWTVHQIDGSKIKERETENGIERILSDDSREVVTRDGTRVSYNSDNKLLSVDRSNNTELSCIYDEQGALVRVVSADQREGGKTVTWTVNDQGRWVSDAPGVEESSSPPVSEQGIYRVTLKDGTKEVTQFDGSLERITPDRVKVQIDPQGMVRKTSSFRRERVFAFDENGRLLKVTDSAKGKSTEWKPPAGARNISVHDNGDVSYVTAEGNRIRMRSNGAVLEYNDADQVTKVTMPDGSTRTILYDGQKLHSITDVRKTKRGDVTTNWHTHGENMFITGVPEGLSKDRGAKYTFDPLGRISSVVYPNGLEHRDIKYDGDSNFITEISEFNPYADEGKGVKTTWKRQKNTTWWHTFRNDEPIPRPDGKQSVFRGEFRITEDGEIAAKILSPKAKDVWYVRRPNGDEAEELRIKTTRQKVRRDVRIDELGNFYYTRNGREVVARAGGVTRNPGESYDSESLLEAKERLVEIAREVFFDPRFAAAEITPEKRLQRFQMFMEGMERRMWILGDVQETADPPIPGAREKKIAQARGAFDELAQLMETPETADQLFDQKTRIKFAEICMYNLWDPSKIRQGANPTCAPTTVEVHGAVQNPDRYADLIQQVSLTGQYISMCGLQPGSDPIECHIPLSAVEPWRAELRFDLDDPQSHGRNPVSKIAQNTLVNIFREATQRNPRLYVGGSPWRGGYDGQLVRSGVMWFGYRMPYIGHTDHEGNRVTQRNYENYLARGLGPVGRYTMGGRHVVTEHGIYFRKPNGEFGYTEGRDNQWAQRFDDPKLALWVDQVDDPELNAWIEQNRIDDYYDPDLQEFYK